MCVSRMAAVPFTLRNLKEDLEDVGSNFDGAPDLELLGPVADGEGERLLVRAPRARGKELAAALRAVSAVRSARKAEPVRVQLDPVSLG